MKQSAEDGAKGFDRIKDGAHEVTQEVGQNLGEAVSSIRGDLGDLAQVGQDTLGGLAASLAGTGPAGMVGAALLAAGAVGAGGLAAAFEEAEERRQALADRANELAQAYIEAGSSVLNSMTIASRSSDILTNEEQRKDAEELARILGVDVATAVRAVAGDQNALAVANKIVADSEQERLDLMKESADYLSGDYSRADVERLAQLQEQVTRVRELNDSNQSANDTFRAQQEVLFGLIAAAGSATVEVDELGNSLYTLPDNTQVLVSADTGQATTDVAAFKGDLDGVAETVATATVRVEVDDSAWRYYQPGTKHGGIVVDSWGGSDGTSWQ